MLRPLDKTSVFCWNPTAFKSNLIGCGTAAGALDLSFSSNTELEIYETVLKGNDSQMKRLASFPTTARFCRLDWGWNVQQSNQGLLAGGMDNGTVNVWNVQSLLEQKESPLLLTKESHKGAVKGIQFNPIQSHVLASGGGDGDIFIWDLNAPGKFVTPGPKSSKLDDITDLKWNPSVQHIMATSSLNGSVVIWDVQNKREIIQLALPNRRPVSAIAWNPAFSTQIFTACEDDSNPVVLGWDLRNAHSPERTLAGHGKGILCMDWCSKDAEMLITAAKDNQILIWNPAESKAVGCLPSSSKWTFNVGFCPKNPDVVASASFDGKLVFHSLQEIAAAGKTAASTKATVPSAPIDPFALQPTANASSSALSGGELRTIPSWFRRPTGCHFAFSGKLFVFGRRSRKISFQSVPEDQFFANCVVDLENVLKGGNLAEYCMQRSAYLSIISPSNPIESVWAMLAVLFSENSDLAKDRLLNLLGLAKDELRDRLRKLSLASNLASETNQLTAAESESVDAPSSSGGDSPTDTCTENATGSAQNLQSSSLSLSAESAIQPHSEQEFVRFITQSIIVGDFTAAVDYCRHANKWADALILAQCGGPEFLAQVQSKYIQKFKKDVSYLSLAKSILRKDFDSLIESTVLTWEESVAVLGSFAEPAEFKAFVSSLGLRLAENGNFFAAICCFACCGDFVNFSRWIFNAIPDIFTEDYVHFIMVLNFANKNVLFSPSIAEVVDCKFIFSQLMEYSRLLAKEGLMSYALKYAQFAEGAVAADDVNLRNYKHRLFSLFNVHSATTPAFSVQKVISGPASAPAVSQPHHVHSSASNYAQNMPTAPMGQSAPGFNTYPGTQIKQQQQFPYAAQSAGVYPPSSANQQQQFAPPSHAYYGAGGGGPISAPMSNASQQTSAASPSQYPGYAQSQAYHQASAPPSAPMTAHQPYSTYPSAAPPQSHQPQSGYVPSPQSFSSVSNAHMPPSGPGHVNAPLPQSVPRPNNASAGNLSYGSSSSASIHSGSYSAAVPPPAESLSRTSSGQFSASSNSSYPAMPPHISSPTNAFQHPTNNQQQAFSQPPAPAVSAGTLTPSEPWNDAPMIDTKVIPAASLLPKMPPVSSPVNQPPSRSPQFYPPQPQPNSGFVQTPETASQPSPRGMPPVSQQAPPASAPQPSPSAVSDSDVSYIVSSFSGFLQQYERATQGKPQARLFEDCKKKMSRLFEELNTRTLTNAAIINSLKAIIEALNSGNIAKAQSIQVDLTMNHYTFVSGWILAVKKLIESFDQQSRAQ